MRCGMMRAMFGRLSEEQGARRAAFVGVGREVAALLEEERPGSLPRAAWRRLADSGVFRLLVEEGALEASIAFEGLGQGCDDVGFLFAANAHLWGVVLPLWLHGGERWLEGALDGSVIGAHAVSEPGAGSDVGAMGTTIVSDGDELVVDGLKTWITGAPEAELFLVFGKDAAGLGVVVLERGDAGLSTGRVDKLGLKGAPMGTVELDAVRVPADRRLGEPGSGMALFRTSLEYERACVFAPFLGAMERQLQRCVRHARGRKAFGGPVGRFQAVSHRIADMQTRLDVARLLLYRAAAARDAGRAPVESSQAKGWIAEAFLQSSLDAMRIFGAAGYVEEAAAAVDLRDALGGPLFSGTTEIQKNIVASFLGVG